jgi:phosphate transport system permease protein
MAVANPPLDAAAAPPKSRAAVRTSARRLTTDRLSRWFVTLGGLAIIASILAILVFIVIEVTPLLKPARVEPGNAVSFAGSPAQVVLDEYVTLAATLDAGGRLRVVRLADGQVELERSLLAVLTAPATDEAEATTGSNTGAPAAPAPAPTVVATSSSPGDDVLALATSDGRVVAQAIEFRVEFATGTERSVTAHLTAPVVLPLDPAGRALGAFAVQAGAGRDAAAAQLADGTVAVARRAVETNDFTGETVESIDRLDLAATPRLTSLLIDREARNLFGGSVDGRLFWWPLGDGARPSSEISPQAVSTGSSAITALTFLIGDRSLVVGRADGSVSIWFPVRGEDERFSLTRVRGFGPLQGAVRFLTPSRRNRTFLAQSEGGELALFYSTSERTLWRGRSPAAAATATAFAPKGDAAVLAEPNRLTPVAIRNPHPEVSWRALFGRLWYEGYERPAYVWQSTGGTDDFESKLSLTPLLVGTLKGTLYSLLLAIPLGVLGAMFASQFLHPKLLNVIKPTVEVMASLPSVVLGFLAGLWLAPMLERTFPALILAFFLVPLSVWLAGLGWTRLPLGIRNRYPTGSEVLLYAVVVAATLVVCVALSSTFERAAFGGSFQAWLLATTGLPYDQRNAVVVGLAMGFAVIPIIFAISEDAFSNVPRNLVAGSLALGANRWQTVTQVVLPTASPGIFSAIMIGFGRAIGETMIVLMATGNTPILDWNAFNGFRTLSANIAVEIPEAPHGGTLYRTLFLAALLLFVLTFVLNTVAEIVRQRLRTKYAQL